MGRPRAARGGNGRARADRGWIAGDPRPGVVAAGCLRPLVTPAERRAHLERARQLFNAGEYWRAHEALETVWRSIIRDGERDAARVWQGLIQAAAALLHQRRGNRHGARVLGRAALEKLAGAERPDVEFETVKFSAQLARALAGEGPPPRLEFRTHAGERH